MKDGSGSKWIYRRECRDRREARKSDQRNYFGCCIAVHTALGPGLLESAYQACVTYELNARGLKVQTQVPLPINYRGVLIDAAYRLDLVIDDLVIVELKAVERLMPIHEAQLLSYLKLSGKRLGC